MTPATDMSTAGPRHAANPASLRGLIGVLLATFALASGCAHSRNVVPPPASALPAVDVDDSGSGVPFAPAPEGLLRPGAVEAIQARLRGQGLLASSNHSGRLDAPTREALRRFQGHQDLPATGLPSYRTIETLGLDPDKAFFSAHRPPADAAKVSSDEKKGGGAAGIGPRDIPPAH